MKTTQRFLNVLKDSISVWLKLAAGTVLMVASVGLVHAQSLSGLPPTLTLYRNQTLTNAFSLNAWQGSNVNVSVEGPALSLLSVCSVEPSGGTDTSRNLIVRGGTAGVAQALRLIASETPTPVHTFTGSVAVTVLEYPTVSYSHTNGFHSGHIDQDALSATLTVTRNAAATIVWGRHSNTTLFPATNIFPYASNIFPLVPRPGQAGSDTFTVFATDNFGGWTNSITVALTVAPVPNIRELDASLTFDEDCAGTNLFSVLYGDNSSRLSYGVTFAPGGLIESHAFLTIGGVSTNRALVVNPYANSNGTTTATLVVSDGTHSRTNTFSINVTAIPDPPSINGLPAEIFISNTDPWTNAFASVSVSDPDDDRPAQERLDVYVSDPDLQIVFADSAASTVSNLNARVSAQTSWMQALTLKAANDLFGVVGLTNTIPVSVVASGRNDNLTVTNTMLVRVYFKNTPPEFVVKVNPGQEQMDELETHTPFTLESITDPDDTQVSFTLSLQLAPGYETYGTLSKSVGSALPPAGGVIGTGNRADLDLLLRNTQFNAGEGVLVNSQGPVYFVFTLSDGFDATVKTNAITLNQLRRPPAIYLGNGAPKDIFITSALPSATPYSRSYVTDPDEAGNQPVSASISVSPAIGDMDLNSKSALADLQTPSALSALLRAATFTPYADALSQLAVGQSVSARITLAVTDETGLSVANSEVVVHIERVNAAPVVTVPEEQPVLFAPGAVVKPFAEVRLASDDTNAVTFTLSIDDPAKGAFGNVDVGTSGFSAQGLGTYTITSPDIGHIQTLVTNIIFTPSSTYPFPPDDPFGTTFTLTAKDYQLLTTSRLLAIQVQDPPRNWLVTKRVNDGTPGTFQHALEHVANNDVITFALPEYPATIRMSSSAPVIETGRTLTIKGPGADLLTISGDSDGNGTPDRQILAIGSPVTIEGVTFAEAKAPVGGAIAVANSNGRLTLRNVVIRDCVATQYGGAIDVVGGRLSVEGCAFVRNSVTEDGYGGGAISTYTDGDIGMTNTLFDSNAQRSQSGAGGALFTEFPDGSLDDYAVIDVVHCTFAGNTDASLDYTASSVYACSGTHVLFLNTVFADDPATRTLNLDSGAEIWSLGGNICDDSTYVPNQQQGGTSVYLLDPDFDLVSTDARLSALDATTSIVPYRAPLEDSPAVGFAAPSRATVLDQRGLLRVPGPDTLGAAGAVDPAAVCKPTITEIQVSAETGDSDSFVEVFVPRNSQDVNLAGYSLFVNGVAVHEFGRGMLALTNSVYTNLVPAAGVAATYQLSPGRGVVVVFPKGEVADFTDYSPLNATPVVRASIKTNAVEFAALLSSQGRGSVALAKTLADAPIVRQTFLTVFNDPDSASGTNLLSTSHNSIASAPQGFGFAFLPHSAVSLDMFGGWRGRPAVVPSSVLLQSPGAFVDGTPFGLRNATPHAVSDTYILTEDDVGSFAVLSNDIDADGNDRLVLVDVSTASASGVGDEATAQSHYGSTVSIAPNDAPLRGLQMDYDPRFADALQALPVGVELMDTFFYEIIDIGSAKVDAIASGSSSNTWVTARHHRLDTGDTVALTGTSVSAYNGTFLIEVIDEHTFAIPVPFESVAEVPGFWESQGPRVPSARSETAVTVKVTGVNDAPLVGDDVVTNVTETSRVRIMVRPELAQAALSLPSDPVPPPQPNPAHLLDNDDDIDTDDAWSNLRLVGVMGAVHPISNYTGVVGQASVTVHSAAHGLVSGDEILLANYGGHPSYNGYHSVTVIDADTFTIPKFFVDNSLNKGVWVILNDANRYHAVTDVGATVDLTLRADPREDNLIYDAAASSFLKGLAEGELFTNRFYQAVEDSHGAIGIGVVNVVVAGLNDTPTARPDPVGLSVLGPLVGVSNSLEQVLADGLDILYTLPAASSTTGRVDVQAVDLSGTLTGTLVLSDLWFTDEDSAITLDVADLLANDSDIDRIDVLEVIGVHAVSREGASMTLAGGQLTYNPAASGALQALAREETLIDTFMAIVSDHMTGGTVTSLVAVLVTGLNDTPVAQPDSLELTEDDTFVFNPMRYPEESPDHYDYDLDLDGHLPDDRLTVIAVSNLITSGEARVDLMPLLARYDATVSQRLNQLADWQDFMDSFEYTVTDNSFFFVVEDEYYVPSNTVGQVLNVLANDWDCSSSNDALTIVDVGPALNGGVVSIAPDGRHLVYSSPAHFVGDDFFRYVVENEAGDRRGARVLVRSVVPALNGVLPAANDHFVVAYGETAILNVIANDNMLPDGAAGLILATNVTASSQAGQPVAVGNAFAYTATNGLESLSFTYEVSAGGEAVASANVVVDVVDRRGTLDVQGDTFSILAGSASNALPVLANDALLTGPTAHLRIAGLIEAATFGTVVPDASATGLLYTPNPDFVGVEQIRYLVTDGWGGTGTGEVNVVVGKIDTAIDFFAVEATTNLTAVALDVLANDGTRPCALDALTLLSVSPMHTPIGSLQVSGSGKRLEFIPSNAVGQVDFTYVVSDSTARMATGTVTIATVSSGIYANTDRFLVRGGGSNYQLDVLANDRSYPDLNKSYSVLSIGTGAEAPSAGGVVNIVSNRLSYSPAVGFYGQESFKYVMSDASATATAWVTVTVQRGDLMANDDHFAVYYEIPEGETEAKSFVLPVVFNDRIQPPLGQSVRISGLGVGTNAPSNGGSVSIGADGLSLVYRPAVEPSTAFVERFAYEISDGSDRRASAFVDVEVINRAGLLDAVAQDDAFTVARNSTGNVLPVLSNDAALPGTAAGWTLTGVSATANGGTVNIAGTAVTYAPAEGFVGDDEFSYRVNDGLGGTGEAVVRVHVGALPTIPDLFCVLSGSVSNEFDVVANDPLVTAYQEEYDLAGVFGATHGGSVEVSASNTVLYAPDSGYAGTYPYAETFYYTVADDAAGLVTGCVRVAVHEAGSDRDTTTVTVHVQGRNDQPAILNVTPPLSITDKQSARPFTGVTLTEVDQQTLEPIDVVVSLDDAASGTLQELGGFLDLGEGRYGITNVTAAAATAMIRNLLFVPTENRIPVPTAVQIRFSVAVTDNKSDVVVNNQSVVTVTAVNDAPVIAGTRSGQTVYAAVPLLLFSSVTITEVDDLTLQPLDVTLRILNPSTGVLQKLGSFTSQGNGVYKAYGLTAAEATRQLREIEYFIGIDVVAYGQPLLNTFQIVVDDRFAAPPVSDSQTSVTAYHSFETMVRATNTIMRTSFGDAVDIGPEYAVVGAPGSDVAGTDSGTAFIYRLVRGTTNTWQMWRGLQPPSVDAADLFGSSVAIHEDLIAVGASQDESNGRDSGAVYLFQRDQGGSNNWGQLIRIAPTNLPTNSKFGYAVALQGDLLAVGAPKATLSGAVPAEGAVFLYGRHQGGTNAWGEIKRWEPAGQTSTDFGTSVSLSGDRLIVGAPKDKAGIPFGTPRGAAFYLSRNVGGSNNWGVAQKITVPTMTVGDDFGHSVSADGDVLAIGAPLENVGAYEVGSVYIYRMDAVSNRWSQVSRLSDKLADSTTAGSHFGHSVSVNRSFIFIGAAGTEFANGGAAYLYRAITNSWTLVERFTYPVGLANALQYCSAVSFKRDVAIVGTMRVTFDPYDKEGRVYMYRFKFNNPPVVAEPVQDQFAEWGLPFSYAIPGGIFTDPDVGDTLTVHAALPTNGHGLAIVGNVVTGTPSVLGPVPVNLEATDDSGARATHAFNVVVLVDGVLLPSTTRNLWDLDHFGRSILDPALESVLWGGGANADGDTLNNDQEYVFGGDPTAGGDQCCVGLAAASDGTVRISYVRRKNDPTLTYTLQGSSALSPTVWLNVQSLVLEETAMSLGEAFERVTVSIMRADAGTAMFFRVVVTQ